MSEVTDYWKPELEKFQALHSKATAHANRLQEQLTQRDAALKEAEEALLDVVKRNEIQNWFNIDNQKKALTTIQNIRSKW